MKKINIEVVDPYQEYFKFNKVYCEHNGVKIQSLVDILGYAYDLKDYFFHKFLINIIKCGSE